jgi:hypothetical protein
MKEVAKLTIDGQVAEPHVFAVPGMSLSSGRSSMLPHTFELRVLKMSVVKALGIQYEGWVVESKRDDAQCGAPQDDLSHAGYPSIELVVDDARLALLVFGSYLREELFAAFCSTGSTATVFWWDTTEACVVEGESLVLRGTCYSRTRRDRAF